MIGNLRALLQSADEGKYAIPAFNYSDQWELYGILGAAKKLRSPVIVATNAQVADTHGIPFLGALGRMQAEMAPIPVVNHLDHCVDREKCKLAIDSGYPSVMIDGSPLPLEENIAWTKEIVAHAAPKGVCVEAEVGRICGNNAEGVYIGDDFLVEVDTAVRMAQSCDIASLAIGIGTAHGFYEKKPELNFKRLHEVNEAVDVPLVLHGGSGLPKEDIQEAIRCGINKVNIGTQLHYTYLQEVQKLLQKDPEATNIIRIMRQVSQKVEEMVISCIQMCMSEGKA